MPGATPHGLCALPFPGDKWDLTGTFPSTGDTQEASTQHLGHIFIATTLLPEKSRHHCSSWLPLLSLGF